MESISFGKVVVSVLGLLGIAGAQSGGNPMIAPVAPNATIHPVQSHLFNWANGVWDLGEGFPGTDNGGAISPTDPSAITPNDIHTLQDWEPLSTEPEIFHYVGELLPAGPVSKVAGEASFEVFIPAELHEEPDPDRAMHIVLLLGTAETRASVLASNGDPHDYPGDPQDYGLWREPFMLHKLLPELLEDEKEFYVATGYIVPRTSFQPLVSSVGRLRELNAAMKLLMTDIVGEVTEYQTEYTTCVTGGSFGGLTTMAAVMLWPDEFHSGASFAFNASLRATVEDQEMFNFLCAGLGLGSSGAGYTMRAAADWTVFCESENTDFLGLSAR